MYSGFYPTIKQIKQHGAEHGCFYCCFGKWSMIEKCLEGNDIDPVCLVHGKRESEHACLYCCLCYVPLSPEECYVLPDGTREDVCNKCAEMEARAAAAKEGNAND